MELRLTKIAETRNSTVSALHTVFQNDEPVFMGFVIEDGYRSVKEAGKTRIPAGTYEVVPRQNGRHFEAYKPKYGHTFTFWIKEVPNFEYIMIHIGNTAEHTEGCLLLNWTVSYDRKKDMFVGSESTECYKNFYNFVAPVMKSGEKVRITINR